MVPGLIPELIPGLIPEVVPELVPGLIPEKGGGLAVRKNALGTAVLTGGVVIKDGFSLILYWYIGGNLMNDFVYGEGDVVEKT